MFTGAVMKLPSPITTGEATRRHTYLDVGGHGGRKARLKACRVLHQGRQLHLKQALADPAVMHSGLGTALFVYAGTRQQGWAKRGAGGRSSQ
jgi:hypothetical protein